VATGVPNRSFHLNFGRQVRKRVAAEGIVLSGKQEVAAAALKRKTEIEF